MDSVSFILDNLEIKFSLSKKLFQKIPDNKESIYNELFNRHKYYVQSKVRKEIFQSFLEYWKDNKFPQINSDNILEYYQLNIEFGFLEDYFSSEEVKEPVFNLSNLLILKKDGSSAIKEIERKIALHLDDYISDYSKDLSKIPITTLYNIFYHPEQNLKNQDKAYQFIIKTAETQNQNFYLLFGSLDARKFSEPDNKRDSVFNKINHLNFAPKNCENTIEKVEQECRSLFDQLTNSKKMISDLNNQNSELNNNLIKSEKSVSDLKGQIINEKKQISDLQNQLSNYKRTISDLNNQLMTHLEKITDLNNLLANSQQAISDLNNLLANSNKKISNLEEQLKSEKQKKLDADQRLSNFRSKMNSVKNISIKKYINEISN